MNCEYIFLNARGTIIQARAELIEKSPVLKNLINGNWKDKQEAYYLDYQASIVHSLLDYLAGRKVNNEHLQYITDELLIEMDKNIVMDYCDLKKLYDEYANKFNEFNLIAMKHNISYDKYNLEVFLSMLSYYKHMHMENIYELICLNVKHFNKSIDLSKCKIIEQCGTKNNFKYSLYDITNEIDMNMTYTQISFIINESYYRFYTINKNLRIYLLLLNNFNDSRQYTDFLKYDIDNIVGNEFVEKIKKYNFETRYPTYTGECGQFYPQIHYKKCICKHSSFQIICEKHENDEYYDGKYKIPDNIQQGRHLISVVRENKNYDFMCTGKISFNLQFKLENETIYACYPFEKTL